jgi:hypothetical protein
VARIAELKRELAALPSEAAVAHAGTLHAVWGGGDSGKVRVALEYLDFCEQYAGVGAMPSASCIVFHVRRICRDALNQYQLMDECCRCKALPAVRLVLERAAKFCSGEEVFAFDEGKREREAEAAERKKHEEGKRRAFEERMARKAKREDKPVAFFLEQVWVW